MHLLFRNNDLSLDEVQYNCFSPIFLVIKTIVQFKKTLYFQQNNEKSILSKCVNTNHSISSLQVELWLRSKRFDDTNMMIYRTYLLRGKITIIFKSKFNN